MKFPLPYEHVLPDQIKCISPKEFSQNIDDINRFTGSLVGLAVGDALGARVEFRPHQYFVDRPIRDMEGGGTWGLRTGQWTDDTSMALCLASSLITKRDFDPYDQMVRYKWWFKHGYMSSTGHCFDIGNATRDSLEEFLCRQKSLNKYYHCSEDELDNLSWDKVQSVKEFDINCSSPGVAGNGALMRLAPVPLFFHQYPDLAVEYAGRSAQLTHGDRKAVDACRYYAALIVAAVRGEPKSNLLSANFYENHRQWFGLTDLHKEILRVAQGSYQRPEGYEDGIRGKGYIVNALEAALWAFWSDKESFEEGVLAAVNLGDDTDTTAAIYGQLAGAFYGYKSIPKKWLDKLYAHELLVCVGKWLYFEGKQYNLMKKEQKMTSPVHTPTKTSLNNPQSSIQWTSAQSIGVNPSSTHLTDAKHIPESRLYNNDLSLPQHYDRSQVHQQSDKQATLHRSNVDQRLEYQPDTNHSRMPRRTVEQLPIYQPENYQSSRFQQHVSSTRRHQPDTQLPSTSRTSKYAPASGSNFRQSLEHPSSHKEFSSYGLDIHRLPVSDLDVSHATIHQLNSKQSSTHGSVAHSPRTLPTERVLRLNSTGDYSYGADQIHIRPSIGDHYLLDETNYRRRSERGANNRSTSTDPFNYPNPVTSTYTRYTQPASDSFHTASVNPNYSNYYIINGRTYPYDTQS